LPKHDPLASFRQPNFLLYTASRSSYTLGSAILQSVMLWQVWDISGSALNLGLMGLARLAPALGISMVGGAVADSYNRRNIIMVTQAVPFACSIVLVTSTTGGWISLPLIYGVVALLGFSAAFEGPARQALLPSIVRPETFANAVNATATMNTLSAMSGPAIGGALIAAFGVATGYSVFSGLSALAIVLMSLVRYRQAEMQSGRLSLESIKEGITFVHGHQVLLGAMTLDLFATIFGGVKALLPIYASDISRWGPAASAC
jgi:MFS family permease